MVVGTRRLPAKGNDKEEEKRIGLDVLKKGNIRSYLRG
jgi:hypothetical protein